MWGLQYMYVLCIHLKQFVCVNGANVFVKVDQDGGSQLHRSVPVTGTGAHHMGLQVVSLDSLWGQRRGRGGDICG